MRITDLLHFETINLNASCKDKDDAINQVISLMAKAGVVNDVNELKKAVLAREQISSTGLGEEVAIPHAKTNAMKEPQIAAMVVRDGVDFDSIDGEKVKLIFFIGTSFTYSNVHLEALARLSQLLLRPNFKTDLLKALTKKDFVEVINKAEMELLQEEIRKSAVLKPDLPDIVAVTACPTGIAHTYMAQEAIEKACKELGLSVKVETRGAAPKNFLTDEEIAHAKSVVVAADIGVPMERFDGKRLISVGTKNAIKDAKGLIEASLTKNAPVYHAPAKAGGQTQPKEFKDSKKLKDNKFKALYRHLLGGLSYMIPFVVAGGILMSISYIIDRCCGVNPTSLAPGQVFGQVNMVAMVFNILGANIILGLMIPILAAFISHSIAGKQGIVSGFTAGFCATTILVIWQTTTDPNGIKFAYNLMWFIDVGVNGLKNGSLPHYAQLAVDFSPGFFGGLFGGFIAGYGTLLFRKAFANFSRPFQGVRDILLIPLLSALFIGIVMAPLNTGFTYLTYGLNRAFSVFEGSRGIGPLIGLGLILGGICAVDMGGPISKAAHLLTIDWIGKALKEGITTPYGVFASRALGASIAGSMVPPICLALACWLFPQKFSQEDRKPAAANLITGIFGITEGAIPYCVAQPRTWIATISGSMIAGMFSIILGGRSISPEGGTITFAVATSVTWTAMMSLVAVIIGSVWAAFVLGLIRKDVSLDEAQLGKWKGVQTQKVQKFFVINSRKVAYAFKYAFSKKFREKVAKEKQSAKQQEDRLEVRDKRLEDIKKKQEESSSAQA